MKVISRHRREAWEQQTEMLREQEPQPIEIVQHDEDEAPKEVAPGVFVMAGDYYHAGDPPFVIAALAVGEGREWEPV